MEIILSLGKTLFIGAALGTFVALLIKFNSIRDHKNKEKVYEDKRKEKEDEQVY
jgi:hypothetical protein